MGIVSVRKVDDDDDDVVADGKGVTVKLQMRDGAPADDAELDDRTRAYLERSADLASAWQQNRAYRAPKVRELRWLVMGPGARKPRAGLPGRDGISDDRRDLPPDLRGADARVFDDAKNQQLRDQAQADYVKRLASAWQQDRG
jgi:hypothetical protein